MSTPWPQTGAGAQLGGARLRRHEDRPAGVHPGTLQHQGTNALAMTRALGDMGVPTLIDPSDTDITHFPVLRLLVQYPAGWTWPLAALATATVVGATAAAPRRGTVTGVGVVTGLVAATVPLAATSLLTRPLW